MTVDTSREAVGRRAAELERDGDNGCAADAATLRALVAERDALVDDIARYVAAANAAEADRDALAARLRLADEMADRLLLFLGYVDNRNYQLCRTALAAYRAAAGETTDGSRIVA